MPYDVRNFLKMANMFGQEKELNPTLIPPEVAQKFLPGEMGGMPTDLPPIPSHGFPPTPAMEPAQNEPSVMAPDAQDMSNQQSPMMPDFTPMTRASDRAYQMLENIPKPNKPGIGRKIGASIVSLGLGPEYGMKALYGPYNTQMEQWKNEYEPTLQAANQERYYNANMRQLADSMLRDKYNQQRADTAQQRADVYSDWTKARIESENKKQALREFIATHDGDLVKDFKSGQWVFRSKTGELQPTGLTHGELTDLEAQNLKDRSAMARVIQSGQNQLNLEGARQERYSPPIQIFMPGGQPGTPYQFNQRGEARPVQGLPEGSYLREVPPGTSSSGDTLPLETPQQELQRRRANAARVLMEHPEWSEWIEFDPSDPSSVPQIKPPGSTAGGFWGTDTTLSPEGYNHLVKEILHGRTQQPSRVPKGGGGPNPTIQAPGKTPAPNAPIQGQPKVGDIRVAPNGLKLRFDGTGWVKAPGQ